VEVKPLLDVIEDKHGEHHEEIEETPVLESESRSHRETSGRANSVNGNEFEGEPAEISVQQSVKQRSEGRGDTSGRK